MIVNSAVPVCFSSSVCICTLKFFGKTHLHIWCFFCRLVHLHLHARRPWVTKHWSQSLYSSCFLAQMYTHAHTLIHTGHRRQTHTYIHTYMHKHILNTHTLSLRSCLCAFSPFSTPPRESQSIQTAALVSADGGGGGGGGGGDVCVVGGVGGRPALLCVTPPLFPPGLNFKSNAPPFSTSIPSPPPTSPHHPRTAPATSIFSDMIPFNSSPLSDSPRLLPFPSSCTPLPSSTPLFSFRLSFSFSFPLYKVFQIYHLYIMMYGYDNVLYYGKMRKIYFCYRFVS